MRLEGVRVGFAVTGSHCTLGKVIPQVQRLVEEGAQVTAIVSPAVAEMDTRFGKAAEWRQMLEALTGRALITSIVQAEPIGPHGLLDVVVIAPCTGNTLAKLANGITDTAVLMAAKAQLRNQRPLVIAISTNDGLSGNARNLGHILNMRNVYLVPFGQDDPAGKPASLVARMDLITDTVALALQGKQIQPLLVAGA